MLYIAVDLRKIDSCMPTMPGRRTSGGVTELYEIMGGGVCREGGGVAGGRRRGVEKRSHLLRSR